MFRPENSTHICHPKRHTRVSRVRCCHTIHRESSNSVRNDFTRVHIFKIGFLFIFLHKNRETIILYLSYYFSPKNNSTTCLPRPSLFIGYKKLIFYLKITWVKVRNKSNTTKFCNHPFSIYSF